MNKRIVSRLGLALFLAAALAGADVWLWRSAEAARQLIASRRSALAHQPSQQLSVVSLQSELNRRQEDLRRLRQYLISRDGLDGFVSRLEAEAKRTQVELVIPTVAERADDAIGTLLDVEFRLTASGQPEQLLQFVHRVELLPYLLSLESWSIKTDVATLPAGSLINAIGLDQAAAPSTPPVQPTGQLEALVILAITRQSL